MARESLISARVRRVFAVACDTCGKRRRWHSYGGTLHHPFCNALSTDVTVSEAVR